MIELEPLKQQIASCVECGTAFRCSSPRGRLSSQVLLVIASPTSAEAVNGYPLVTKWARMFHEILEEEAAFNTTKDCFVVPLVWCVQPNREKVSTKIVKNCRPIFDGIFNAPQFKLVMAAGYDVARHLINEGGNIPKTLVGNSVPIERKGAPPVEVFVFDDPELIEADITAVGFDKKTPKEAFYWRERLRKQAATFGALWHRRIHK